MHLHGLFAYVTSLKLLSHHLHYIKLKRKFLDKKSYEMLTPSLNWIAYAAYYATILSVSRSWKNDFDDKKFTINNFYPVL